MKTFLVSHFDAYGLIRNVIMIAENYQAIIIHFGYINHQQIYVSSKLSNMGNPTVILGGVPAIEVTMI